MRVSLADDAVVIRQGVARLLADEGIEVVAQVDDADALRQAVRELCRPLDYADQPVPYAGKQPSPRTHEPGRQGNP